MLARWPLRVRLTLAFVPAMAFVLAATGTFVYLRVESSLTSSIDASLQARVDDLAAHLRPTFPILSGEGKQDLGERLDVTQIIGPGGRVLQSTTGAGATPIVAGHDLQRALQRTVRLERGSLAGSDNGPWRVLARPVQTGGRTVVVAVASSAESREEALSHLLVQLLVGGAAALALATLVGYRIARAALRPVEEMGRRASEISHAGAGQRLPVPGGGDEIARLGERLNEMLANIETAAAHERRFLADASHELRTPLTILRSELEIALRRPRSQAELEETVRNAASETERLAHLAEDLLFIARADQGGLPVRRSASPASEIVTGVAERFAARAAEVDRRIESAAPPGLEVDCDPVRVAQALANLVENALRHGAGTITISAVERNGAVEFHVSDEGSGFPEDYLDRAFERFSRADGARTGGGAGLGLAIVDAIAQAHGGTAKAGNRPQGGSDVWLSVPKHVR